MWESKSLYYSNLKYNQNYNEVPPHSGQNGSLKTPQIVIAREDEMEKEMTTHSRIPAWEISWAKEPCRLQSTGSQKELDTTEWTCTAERMWRKQYTFYTVDGSGSWCSQYRKQYEVL